MSPTVVELALAELLRGRRADAGQPEQRRPERDRAFARRGRRQRARARGGAGVATGFSLARTAQ